MKLFLKRAQSTAEYAIVIALVIGAAVAMQVYVRRGFQRGMKFATDQMMDIKGFETNPLRDNKSTGQYEPYYMQSESDTARLNVKSSEEFKAGGAVERKTGLTGEGEQTERAYKQENRGIAAKD